MDERRREDFVWILRILVRLPPRLLFEIRNGFKVFRRSDEPQLAFDQLNCDRLRPDILQNYVSNSRQARKKEIRKRKFRVSQNIFDHGDRRVLLAANHRFFLRKLFRIPN